MSHTCALYFGSFNPIHYGHISIAKYLLDNEGIDEVRFILSPKNPLKKMEDLEDANNRLASLRKTVDNIIIEYNYTEKQVTVSDIEFTMSTPRYTLKTLKKIISQDPETNFILVIGGDNITIIEKWYGWKELLTNYEIWVYPRVGYEDKLACRLYNHSFKDIKLRYLEDAPKYNISSTELRLRKK